VYCLLTCLLAAAPPTLTSLFPAGAARGQTIEVTAAGTHERWPLRVWTSDPGLTFEATEEKGKLRASVAGDALPGIHWVRLYDEQGASALRPFRVGTIPEVLEVEPNDGPDKAQKCERLPLTIHGKLGKRGDVDGFAVTLKAGETFVASLEGQRLGSPMDAVLQIASIDGLVLSQVEDSVGLDPVLVYRVSADGRYLVRAFAFPATPDSSIAFAGGDAFIYRLTLTTGTVLDHALPTALGPDGPTNVGAVGWSLPEATTLTTSPLDGSGRVRAFGAGLDQTLDLPVLDLPSRVADEITPEQTVEFPMAITGRIDRPKEVDIYTFSAKKGQTWKLRVVARTMGSPLDAALQVLDASGKVLAEADDVNNRRDPELTFKAPEVGTYRVGVRDVTDQGGMRYVYRLEAFEPRPDFELTLPEDRVTVAAGKSVEFKVTVNRLEGFDGSIEVQASGLPEGVTAKPAVSEGKGATAKEVKVTLEAASGAGPFQGTIGVVGKASIGDKEVEKVARFAIPGFDAPTSRVWFTVVGP
jgi:hypothetical protein